MLARIDLRGLSGDLRVALARPSGAGEEVAAAVAGIVADVRARGDDAVRDLTERFDGCRLDELAVSTREIAAAREDQLIHPELLAGLQKEYRERAAAHPEDPLALYLAAHALIDTDTPRSIHLLEKAGSLAPTFAWPSLDLAQIYSMGKFADKPKFADQLTKFWTACPASQDRQARWMLVKVPELQKQVAKADKRTLIRRASFDLTGLPPSPEAIEAFVNDDSPTAFAKVVDTLLASQQYGEKWARHWLDVARYAEDQAHTFGVRPRNQAWRYRDWVMAAFNADMPYDRFLQLQIAGDEITEYWAAQKTAKKLPPEVVDGLVATGFLRCASDTSRPDFTTIKNAPGYYFQTLDDTVKIVTTATMGLTLHCAKCHSHKFDPIPHRD